MNVQGSSLSIRERIDEELRLLIEGADTGRLAELVAAVQGNPNYPDLRYRLARLYYIKGDYQASLAELEAATAINNDFSDALRLQAAVLAVVGRMTDALDVLQKLLDRHPDDAETYYRKAVILARLGRHGESLESAKAAVELQRGHELAHVLLGERYLIDQKWPLAIRHYESANRIRPHEDYCYFLALLHLQLGRNGRATEFLEQALKLKPNHLNSCVRLAILKLEEGNYERAYGLLRLAIQFYPRYPDLCYSLAKICLLMGRREEAYEMMRAALEINPRYAEVRREIGYLHSTRDMNREAVAEIKQSLEINPDDEQAYLSLGYLYGNQGDHTRAVDILEQALERFPDSWRLHHGMGIVQLQEKSFSKARLSFQNAIRINPELESVQRGLRIVFQDEALLEEERDRIERTFSRREDQPARDHHLGLIHLDFHKEKLALNHFQSSLESGYRPVLNSLLLATVQANRRDALSASRRVESVKGEGLVEDVRLALLALFQANAGTHEAASRHYQQLMSTSPLFFHALGGLVICFREREELDDMLDDYMDFARFRDRSARLFCRIAEINAQRGRLLEAKQHFYHATVLDPNDARPYHSMGILHLLRLDIHVAIDFFLKAVDRDATFALPHLGLALIYRSQARNSLANVSLKRYLKLEAKEEWREAARPLQQDSEDSSLRIAPKTQEAVVSAH